jgi:ribosomal protein S18 acetylase RimI-like enzyme
VNPRITLHRGPHEEIRELFELAEDSASALASYIGEGRVLVATEGQLVVGHLQLVDTGDVGAAEIRNMAVRPDRQGHGIGRSLVHAAVELLRAEAVKTCLRVATATADIGNLRFYQRLGFRMTSIERDAFTPAAGYPAGLQADGIAVRDRVWLTLDLDR